MLYRIVADVIVTVHFAYVAFVIVGLAVTLIGAALHWKWVRNFWFRIIHLLMIGIVVAEPWLGIVCPLTTLENRLRELGGQATYTGGFVAELLHDVLVLSADPWVFTLCYSLFGLAVLGTLVFIPPRRPNWSRQFSQTAEQPERGNMHRR
jgi:hypothetical protein